MEVASLRPTFRWQPLPVTTVDPSTQPSPDRLERVTYELRVWRTDPIDGGKLVYTRKQLTTTEHRLEMPLTPGTRYLWSTRAHFTVDCRPRTSEWSLAGYLLRNETVPNDSCFRFRTPLKESLE